MLQTTLAVMAAVAASLAGVLQAMGSLRWVMAVPGLAARADVAGFAMIHDFAGVAEGEHLGQLLIALHVALVAALQAREGRRVAMTLGATTAAAISFGAFKGVAVAIGWDGGLFGIAAIGDYLALTIWMIVSGLEFIRPGSIAAGPKG